ncbi:MAG: cellulase, partial [Cytophagales bacterium]|nr:cellulase [Cytophagales bacterium]
MIPYTIKISTCLLALGLAALPGHAQQPSEAIRLNQIGFYPDAPKIAVVPAEAEGTFTVTTADRTQTVFTGTLGAVRSIDYTAKKTRLADFSKLTRPGTYVVVVPKLGHSYAF